MTALLIAALAFVVVVAVAAPGADAHMVKGLRSQVTVEAQRKIARITHDVFRSRRRAHRVQRLYSCESEFRWWLQGPPHWGMPQFDEDALRTYGGRYWDGWSRREQVRATKRMILARGFQPWPYCGPRSA